MNNSEVLEAILLSRPGLCAAARAPITSKIFEGHRNVVRILFQKANCPRIGRALVNFVRPDSLGHQGWEMANPVRCDSYSNRGNTVNSIINSRNLVGSIDEKIIDRLRAQLLRIRVAGKLGQDFLMNKHIMELEALCREASTDSDAVLHTNVLRDLWDVLKHGRGEFWGARQCSPQPLCSLSEDAAAISKARNILQHAASKDAGVEKGGKRRSHHAMNPSRAKESIDHISSATVPSPADVLPLLVLAETLGASVAVNTCLDSIHANQKEVIDVARTLFDPGVDWASAVARLAKWPRMAEKSPPPPPPRTLETAGFPARGEAIETISASGAEVERSTSPLADSGSLDEGRQDRVTDRIRQCDHLENVKPTSNADRGQSLGKEEKRQPHTFKPTGTVNEIGRNEGSIARFAWQDVIPKTNSSQRHAHEELGLENQSQPGEPLRHGSTETSWRFSPTASPAPSPKLSASLPQRPVLHAGRPGEERRKKGNFWSREPSHCSRQSEGYHGRHRASTHRLELCSVECDIFHDCSDGRGQQTKKGAEQNSDAALDIESSPADSRSASRQKSETGKAIEQVPCFQVGEENLSDDHSTAPSSESEKRWSPEISLGLSPLSPKSCAVPFACESAIPQRRKGLRRLMEMRCSHVSEGNPSRPLLSKNVRSSSTREPSPERGFPVSTINSWISERAASREYENSCALARKRALLRVRLARQKSALATAEACHREQMFGAECRRRRDQKLAELLLKTSGVAVLKQAVQRNGGVGDCDGGCHPGNNQGSPRIRPVTVKNAPSPFPSTTTTVWDGKSTVDYSGGEEARPRRPLSIKPEKPGTMSLEIGNVRNTGNRCNHCAAATASKEYHHVCPDSAGMSTALSTLAIRIDALYSLPARGSRPHGRWGKACAEVCLLLKAGRFRHRTTAQHPECCKHGTCKRLSYRGDSRARRTRERGRTDAARAGAFNVEHTTWVFGETVILRFAPEGSDDRRSVFPNNLRVLVYGSGCKDSSSEDDDRSISRDRRSVCDIGFDGAARWGLVGVAILPLRGGHVAVGNPVDVNRKIAGEECSFSRSLVVSVEGTEGEHPIGLVEIGVCRTTTCGRS